MALSLLHNFIRDEEGANLVEYALLVTLIALVVFGGASALGNSTNTWFNNMSTTVGNWAGQALK